MPWRLSQTEDLAQVEHLLRQHVQSSMFLLGNLLDHGLGSGARHGLTLWQLEPCRGVFAITNSGMVLMQAPDATSREWQAAATLIADRRLSGASGEAAQLRRFLQATGLDQLAARKDEDERSFRLELSELVLPECDGTTLLPLSAMPRDTAVAWRSAYLSGALGTPVDEAAVTAVKNIDAYLSRDSHRVLTVEGQPVAMTGFNAEVPGVVQVGGVYTPPHLRGRGYARRALALHLAQARARGVEQAVLFTGNPAAARAYQAVGFQPAGAYGLLLFDAAQTLCISAQSQEET
jgi:RimJ/RimL family protein N-acetyltransferase